MISNSSYTAAVTFDLVGRVKRSLDESEKTVSSKRRKRLEEVKARARSLEERGLLKRQEYAAPSTADFERRFVANRPSGAPSDLL